MLEPFEEFAQVLELATETCEPDANAMTVSTVDSEGRPSSRAVLLKFFDKRGFVFYTNLQSRKARDIEHNPVVCLHFLWRRLGRQVAVRGTIEPVEPEEADAYFKTRDRKSQLGAWASKQSQQLESWAQLLARVARCEARYIGRQIPRPPHWSGYRVVPDRFEFWTAGKFRLHRRWVFEKSAGSWEKHQLFP